MISQHDPVIADLNRYLDRIEEEDRRETAIEDATTDLLEGDYSPAKFGHFVEALTEVSDPDEVKRITDACAYIHRANTPPPEFYTVLGKAVWSAAFAYWARLAKQQAEEDYDKSYPSCRAVAAAIAKEMSDERP